jgi:hypothetical protein
LLGQIGTGVDPVRRGAEGRDVDRLDSQSPALERFDDGSLVGKPRVVAGFGGLQRCTPERFF